MNIENDPSIEVRVTISLNFQRPVCITLSVEVKKEGKGIREIKDEDAKGHSIDYQSSYEVSIRTLHIGEKEQYQIVVYKVIVIPLAERQFHFLYKLAQVLIKDGEDQTILSREKEWVKLDDLVLPEKVEQGGNMKKEFRRQYRKDTFTRNLFKLRQKLERYGADGQRLIEGFG